VGEETEKGWREEEVEGEEEVKDGRNYTLDLNLVSIVLG
jgi:hypothetical protein